MIPWEDTSRISSSKRLVVPICLSTLMRAKPEPSRYEPSVSHGSPVDLELQVGGRGVSRGWAESG